MRTKLNMVEQSEDHWEEDRKCEQLKRTWLSGYLQRRFVSQRQNRHRANPSPVSRQSPRDPLFQAKDGYWSKSVPKKSCKERTPEDDRFRDVGRDRTLNKTSVKGFLCKEECKLSKSTPCGGFLWYKSEVEETRAAIGGIMGDPKKIGSPW